ncbi:MAG: DUF6952 family protein [Bacteroidia bacterium]
MKLAAIKQMAESHDLATLKAAEEALLNEENPPIEVAGDDEGDQLTNILGAIWISEQVSEGMAFKEAFRAFAQRVRDSIN